VEDLTETVVEGIGVKATSGSQFGRGIDDAGNNHGDDEVAMAAGSRIEDGIEVQVAQATEDRSDMAVRQGASDAEGVWQRGGGDSQRAGQCQAEGVNLLRREVSDIGDGASLDFAIEAIGLAEEDSGRGVAIGDGGDVHAYILSQIVIMHKHILTVYMPTQKHLKLPAANKTKGFPRLAVRTSG
jgi:hypothetical protein